MLVLAQIDLLGLERLEPGPQGRGVRRQADACGQGVDEDAHEGVGAGQLRRPARDGVAKDDVLLAGVVREDESPRGERQRVQRELVLACEGLEGGRGLGGEVQLQGDVLGLPAVGHDGVGVRRKRRGRSEAVQVGAPEGRVGGGITTRQPVDVVAEGSLGRRLRRATGAQGRVEGEDLADEQANAPAIHQQVVMAPQEAHGRVRQTDGRQSHQRRTAQLEASLLILEEELLEAVLLLRLAQGAPVELFEGQLHPRVDHLERRGQLLPMEGGAQDGVPLEASLPGSQEGGLIQRGGDGPRELLEVGGGRRREQGVEEHALLRGGQRVDVLDVGAGLSQHGGERRLGEGREGEVPGREAAGILGSAQVDEGAQVVEEALSQRLDGGRVVQVGAVAEGQTQAALEDGAVDLQCMQPRARRRDGRTRGVGAQGEEVAGRGRGVELAQVVEGHLRHGQGLKPLSNLCRTEPLEQAKAEAMVGQQAQGVAHGAQAVTGGAARGHGEQHGGEGREPTDGARDIHAVEELLASVALQVDEHLGLAGPLGQGAGQGGEQHVVDLRTPCGRRLLEQLSRLFRVERDGDGALGGVGVGAGGVGGQRRHPNASLVQPEGGFGGERLGAGMVLNAACPGLEGGRLRRQRHGKALLELVVGGLQVLQQHAPGNTVDDEVVGDEEQALLAVAQVEERGAQQGRLGEDEAGLHARGFDFERGGLLGSGRGGEIHLEQVDGRLVRAGVLLGPGGVLRVQAQTQCIVVGHHERERLLQDGGLQRGAGGQEHGLVEVVGVGRVMRQQLELGGRERHRTGDGALLAERLGGGLRHERELSDRLVLEELAGGEHEACPARACDDLEADDGVAAQLKEVVVDAHQLQAEHLRPDVA
ncbi:hypothetical protein COSO111634_34170 [Corallococcus soli]